MSVQIVLCDGCGKKYQDADYMIEFRSHGITVHLCDECIDAAKEIIDSERKAVEQ